MADFDALLVLSYGGPEKADDVMPFLENVLRGRNVPRTRLLEVAEHYHAVGGVSPINGQNRALIAAVERELAEHDISMPIYFGNRNWHPLLADTLGRMMRDGVQRALVFVTSGFSSYSSCRQYLEDMEQARRAVGDGAPQLEKLRQFFNHPGFIDAMADRVQSALAELPAAGRSDTAIVCTAHSIPQAMAANCCYVEQLHETARLVGRQIGRDDWTLVYQSRSGPPAQPWLEPDVCDYLRDLHARRKARNIIIVPIGFVSDHMEVVFDLDIEAKAVCDELGMNMVRAGTAGIHRRFVTVIRQLIEERMIDNADRHTVGKLAAWPDRCAEGCCLSM